MLSEFSLKNTSLWCCGPTQKPDLRDAVCCGHHANDSHTGVRSMLLNHTKILCSLGDEKVASHAALSAHLRRHTHNNNLSALLCRYTHNARAQKVTSAKLCPRRPRPAVLSSRVTTTNGDASSLQVDLLNVGVCLSSSKDLRTAAERVQFSQGCTVVCDHKVTDSKSILYRCAGAITTKIIKGVTGCQVQSVQVRRQRVAHHPVRFCPRKLRGRQEEAQPSSFGGRRSGDRQR